MPISVTYPGVYVQEAPSGVRTITGVGTSVGMFIGRASEGMLYEPVQCTSFEDVVRAFGAGNGGSELISSVRLFFANGGTNCYVMRVADDTASVSKLSLLSETKDATKPALIVAARSAGPAGDSIRLAVSYGTAQPESTFNLEIFRWQAQSNGSQVRTAIESHLGLSMDPAHPRYVKAVIDRDSRLVTVEDPATITLPANGTSQSGFAISATNDAILQAQLAALLARGTRFGLSVDGAPAVTIDLSSQVAVFGGAVMNQAAMETSLTNAINAFLPANRQVAVSFAAGPAGTLAQPNASTRLLTITRVGGDVAVTPSMTSDLAVPLLLGTAQGGVELSRYGVRRPAATAVLSTIAGALGFSALEQDAIDTLEINGTEVYFTGATGLTTTIAPGISTPKMFQDATATNYHDGRSGLREKLAIIAAAIVAKRAADPAFEWSAEVWGNRLALVPAGAAADSATAVVRAGKRGGVLPPAAPAAALPVVANVLTTLGLGATLQPNVRYLALGATPAGTYYAGGTPGNPGGPPQLQHYDRAYRTIDREVDLFNLLVLPSDSDHTEATQRKLWGPASVFCQQRRAFLLIDPPAAWTDAQKAVDASVGVNTLRIGLVKDYSAVFFPRIRIDEGGREIFVGPSGAIAGLCSRIDSARGVWKAPAGTEADLRGVLGVERRLSDGENGITNPKAVNTIRVLPNGIVNWGARTMDGDDAFGSEYKYIPIRRLALFMEESLYRGLKWTIFEPNDEPLWAQIRLNVGAFMHNLFRQGAFQGATPREAYFVKCDASTTTQNDRNLGVVNVVVGFAPLKPAEFLVLIVQQMAGQIET